MNQTEPAVPFPAHDIGRAATLNVTEAIDTRPIGAFQIRVILLCSLVAFLDGLDTQSIAVAAPLIAGQLKLARSAMGPIFSAALFGAMLGALTFGPLADRFGRKTMLVLATLCFGTFTLLTAFAQSYDGLLAVRFAAGLGLGGATPCFLALASEYAPARRRAMVTSLLWAAFPLGGVLGAFINAYILSHFTWQIMFIVGGVLPFFVAIALVALLPESVRLLIANGDPARRARTIMERIVPGLTPGVRLVADEERVTGVPVKHIFAEGRAMATLLLWVPFFCAFGILAIVVVWTPLLLKDSGIGAAQASIVIGANGIGSLIGMASAGRLMERFGAVRVLAPALILGGIATAALGHASASLDMMLVVIVLVGLFVGLGASGSIALAALSYPTAVRSTGIGWAMGMGRFGQVVAPLAATVLIANGADGIRLFHIFGIAPCLGALAVLVLRRKKSADGAVTGALLPNPRH